MAASKESQLTVNQFGDVLYENCNPNMEIEGEKLSSIIDYAISAMGVSVDGKNAEEMYDKYCDGLKKKLKSSEPYYTCVEMKEFKKSKIICDMKDLLPQKVEKFDKLIEKAAERAVAVLDVSAQNAGHIFFRQSEKEFIASEFSVLKIFKSGDNLEIIPCYMSVRGKKIEKRVLFVAQWQESESKMDYKQQKFILTKFDIKAIIKKLSKEAEGRW